MFLNQPKKLSDLSEKLKPKQRLNRYLFEDACRNKKIDVIKGYYNYLFNKEPENLTLRQMCVQISEEIEKFESVQEGYDTKIDCCVNQDQEMCQQIGFEKENCIEFLKGNQCLSLISGKDFKDLMINELFVFEQDNQRYCF